jgi:hypothetical protein
VISRPFPRTRRHSRAIASLFAAAGLLVASPSLQAATFLLINNDGVGEGFNDPTPVAPIGGNPGTTLGEQRLNVFRTAGAIWGTYLPDNVTIRVQAQFNALTPCDATSGVLGSAGAIAIAHDFTNAPVANTDYSIALANKIAGTDLAPATNDINAQFNSSVDNSTCLGTTNWYYGYDHDNGTNVDLLAVVLHEFGHGLGFQTFANISTGQWSSGGTRADIYGRNLFDRTFGLRWDQMTPSQRAASVTNTGNLVWNGAFVTNNASRFLGPAGMVRIDSPVDIAGEKEFGTADFGPPLGSPAISAEVVEAMDANVPTTDVCSPIVNVAQVAGKIAIIDRGTCTFLSKAQAAQAAGAVAVIIVNNVAGQPPGMSGTDPSMTIPTVSVTQDDGFLIRDQISLGNTVMATIGVDPAHLAGTDPEGRVRLYAPSPAEPGSSVSHFDTPATPNLLMEPFINDDLTSSVDLTQYAFVDIGWLSGTSDVPVGPSRGTVINSPRAYSAPNPFRSATTIRFEMTQDGRTQVEVFDAHGALVKRLPVMWRLAGPQAVDWDGTDAGGKRAPAGVYFWRVTADGTAAKTGRMVRVQ